MYRSVFFIQMLISIVCVNCAYSQVQTEKNDSEILWDPAKKLTWDDFCGDIPSEKGATVAEVQCKILITKAFWDKNLPKYELGCFFIKSESWTSVTDSIALQHEQLHFDIYELYTRKIRKEFEKLNLKGETNTEVYNKTCSYLMIRAEEENNKYDSEVYFNEMNQREWINNIAKELNDLKKYEQTTPDSASMSE